MLDFVRQELARGVRLSILLTCKPSHLPNRRLRKSSAITTTETGMWRVLRNDAMRGVVVDANFAGRNRMPRLIRRFSQCLLASYAMTLNVDHYADLSSLSYCAVQKFHSGFQRAASYHLRAAVHRMSADVKNLVPSDAILTSEETGTQI